MNPGSTGDKPEPPTPEHTANSGDQCSLTAEHLDAAVSVDMGSISSPSLFPNAILLPMTEEITLCPEESVCIPDSMAGCLE